MLVYDTWSSSSVNGMYCQVGGGVNMNGKGTSPSISVNVKYTVVQNKNRVTVNGTAYSYSGTVANFTASNKLRLMSAGSFAFKGKIYAFKVNDISSLSQIRDLSSQA